MTDANITDKESIQRFNRANLFGPIFICSCCKRRLFENGVSKITNDLKRKIEEKKQGLYEVAIKSENLVTVNLNSKSTLSGSYICST